MKQIHPLKLPKIHLPLHLSTETLVMLIWTFYSSASCLFWVSNLKRSFAVDGVMKLCDFMTAGMLAVVFLFDKRIKTKEFIALALFVSATAIVEIAVFNRDFAVMMLFMLCFMQIDFRKFIAFDMKLKIIWTALIILMCKAGIIRNFADYFNGTFKQSLGFQHPNTFAMFCFIILLEWLFLRYQNGKFIEMLAVPAVWLVVMKIAPARTTGFTFLGVYFLFLVARYFPGLYKSKIVRWGLTMVGSVVAVVSVLLTELYIANNKFALKMNEIMTNRIQFQALYWKTYPVRLFGGKIDTSSEVLVILDSGYIRCILTYGIVLSALLCVFFSVLTYRALKNGHTGVALMVTFFLLMGFAETAMLRLVMNVTFLAVFNRSCTGFSFSAPKFPVLNRILRRFRLSD